MLVLAFGAIWTEACQVMLTDFDSLHKLHLLLGKVVVVEAAVLAFVAKASFIVRTGLSALRIPSHRVGPVLLPIFVVVDLRLLGMPVVAVLALVAKTIFLKELAYRPFFHDVVVQKHAVVPIAAGALEPVSAHLLLVFTFVMLFFNRVVHVYYFLNSFCTEEISFMLIRVAALLRLFVVHVFLVVHLVVILPMTLVLERAIT